MHLGGRAVDLRRPWLVGILNLTPDSFSDGGLLQSRDDLLFAAERIVAEGADLLDLGGESTRPGAAPVSEQEEIDRLLPAIQALHARFEVPLSADTRRAVVARAALAAGAVMVNDVSGFADPDMGAVVAASGAAWVLMHMPHAVGAMAPSQRTATMSDDLHVGLQQVAHGLAQAVARAQAAGVARSQLAIDPGIGFGKTLQQNLCLLRGAAPIAMLDLPVYLGPSRKSFIAAVAQAATADLPSQRLFGTAAAVAAAVLGGAAFVRVHDVAAMRQVLDVAVALRDVGG